MSVSTLYYRMAKGIAPYIGLDEDETQRFLNDAPGISILMVLLACRVYQHTDGKLPRSCWHIPDFEWPVGLTDGEAYGVDRLLHSVFPTFVKAVKGNPRAQLQVDAIKKIVDFHAHNIVQQDIEKFITVKSADSSRARAFEIRKRMQLIAPSVTPQFNDVRSVLFDANEQCPPTVEILPHHLMSYVVPQIDSKVRMIIKKNNTLESLAIKFYKNELGEQGIHITERQLRNDLNEFRDWKPEEGERAIPLTIHTFNKQGECVNSEQLLIGSSDKWKQDLVNRKIRAKPSVIRKKTRK